MQSVTEKSLFFKSLRSKQTAFFIVVSTVMVTIISLGIYEGNKKTVTLAVNGEMQELKTYAPTVSDLLSEQEIEVSGHDIVTPSMNAPVEDGLSIQWEQAKQVALEINQKDMSIWTTKTTVGDMLDEAGIELSKHDKVTPGPEERLGDNNTISVEQAYEFTLIDEGRKSKYWTTSTTIEEFLKSENIQLDEFDRLEGNKKDVVDPNSVVQIVRVEKVADVVEDEATFAIETRNDESLLKGHEKVVQQGEKGKVSREFEVVKEDGKEVSRKMIAEKTLKEPKTKIVAIGTKVVVASAAPTTTPETAPASKSKKVSKSSASVEVSRSNSAASEGGEEFYVSATAYTAGCNGCTGVTATGINLKSNPDLKVIAVDPSVIPLGSKVWVEGYGYAVAGDTGGAIKGKKIDLHFPTKSAAYKFGNRQVKMKVIK